MGNSVEKVFFSASDIISDLHDELEHQGTGSVGTSAQLPHRGRLQSLHFQCEAAMKVQLPQRSHLQVSVQRGRLLVGGSEEYPRDVQVRQVQFDEECP